MSFKFASRGERPEWMPPAGHYVLGLYHLGETMVDYKQGKGPEEKAEWGFVVLAGPHAGKRIIETTSFSFFPGSAQFSPATAYTWVKVLRFKGAPPPPDYEPISDDIVGRIAEGTCIEDAKGWLRVSKDLLPVTTLPDGLTLEGIEAIMERARIDHAAVVAAKAADNGGFTNGATTPAFDESQVPF